ncbi:DMT family transporter [Microcella frigidaquae]|uniref:Drug/metabolite transporter (DMT)-like permease n=1 Tax=Microcella frigidaquae TaxID=424758 RepID=A0A840XL06_9MICO|nr:drug/metabolite transporter (DMT)-like permease [Microcella frigidaquae]NHN44821.1 multidrug DMT transporter permease [Microcella frigidaquae]
MPPELTDLTEQITLTPYQAIGIPIALIGAVFLSLGAQLQHRGVARVELSHGDGTKAGLSMRQLLHLAARPSWLFGTVLLGLAILFQLTSLGFAPLIVVQPLGVVALVITAIVNARVSRIRLERPAIRAIVMCVGGVGVFVAIAAVYAIEQEISERQLLIVLGILGVTLAAFGVAFALARRSVGAMFYILGAGVLFGFVATLAKVVINRILNGNFEWLTVLAIVALLASAALGSYFVQTAYSVGSPDLVIAGLTVVDPLVAVLIGVIVLGEAALIPPLFAVVAVAAGALAVFGVIQLAKHHPQTHR